MEGLFIIGALYALCRGIRFILKLLFKLIKKLFIIILFIMALPIIVSILLVSKIFGNKFNIDNIPWIGFSS